MNLIEMEQQKHNDRKLRPNMSQINQPNAPSASTIIPDADDHKASQIPTTQRKPPQPFINQSHANKFKEPLDLNFIAKNVQNVKYYHDDDQSVIRNRLRRSIKRAKKRQWKKTDQL